MARRLSLLVNDAWPATWSDVYEDVVATDESIEVAAFRKPSTSACTTHEVSSATGLLFLQECLYPSHWNYTQATVCSCNACTKARECSLLSAQRLLHSEYPYYADGSLLSCLKFFVDFKDMPVQATMQILCMKNKDVFEQCRAAAVAMNAVFPRGIQVFKLGCTTASWYFSVFGNVKSESFEDGVDFSSMQSGMASLVYEGCTFVPVLYPGFQCRLGRLLECCYHCMWQGVCEHTGAVSMMLATPLPRPHPYFHKCCAKLLFYLEYPSEAPADVSYTVMRQTLVLHTPSGGYYGSPGSLLSALSFFMDLASLPMDARMCLLEMGRKDTFQQCRLAAVVLRAMLPHGIQLFKFGRKPFVWHFSAFGDVWHTSLKDGITACREHSHAASVVCERRVLIALFCAFALQL